MFTKEECETIIAIATTNPMDDSKTYFKYDDDIKYKVSNVKRDETTDWIFVKMLDFFTCLLYTSPSPRDRQKSRMPSSA